MRYVHEFVDELDCVRCPHNAPADGESGWGDFDYVCLARDDGDEFIFPDGCPAYLGPWGAWRSLGSWLVNDEVSAASWTAYLLWERIRAVGWSP
jgi:hypothetical protein